MTDRLTLLIERDGLDAAVEFAERTMRVYRTAVLTSRKRGCAKPHHASLPEYRRNFIMGYLSFKQFISRNRQK
jgi:hypothetical protein